MIMARKSTVEKGNIEHFNSDSFYYQICCLRLLIIISVIRLSLIVLWLGVLKVPHYTYTYTVEDTTSQDGDLNVLLYCLYRSIGLYIAVAQWLMYWASELQIMNLNPPGAFVHVNCIYYSKM